MHGRQNNTLSFLRNNTVVVIWEFVTSYFGLSHYLNMSSFDPRLLPEFSGCGKDEIVVAEWLSNLEWLCKLHKVSDLCPIIPLRLTGDAYKVYDQLPVSEV